MVRDNAETWKPATTNGANSPQDIEQLRLLVIFNYIASGLTALISCFALIHVTIGIFSVIYRPPDMPFWFGWIFIIVGSMVLVSGWTLAGFTAYSARCIKARKRRILSIVVACLNCATTGPIGLGVGIFTMIVLMRPSVRAIYEGDLPAMTEQASKADLAALEDEEEARWKSMEEQSGNSMSLKAKEKDIV